MLPDNSVLQIVFIGMGFAKFQMTCTESTSTIRPSAGLSVTRCEKGKVTSGNTCIRASVTEFNEGVKGLGENQRYYDIDSNVS